MKRWPDCDILILASYISLVYVTLPIAPALYPILYKVFGPYLGAVANTTLASILASCFWLFYSMIKGKGLKSCLGLATVFLISLFIVVHLTPIVMEKIHLLEYGFLSYLASRVFRDISPRDKRFLYVILVLVAVGWCDELIQLILPNRFYEIRDVALNVLSGLLGLAVVRLLE